MKKIFLLIIVFGFNSHILAFGQIGHRITGDIAERYLSENARSKLSSLLGNESLAEASTYVDEMRSSPDEFWQKTASPYHYVTIPKGKTYQQVGAPKWGDAVTALSSYSKIVKDPLAAKKDKILALKFIVHIIGDLHQPLHVGNGTDRGGNDVKLKFFGSDSNLHRVWDSAMINNKQLSFTEWANWLNRTIAKEDVRQWSSIEPKVWITESALIRDAVYPETDFLKYQYLYENLPILKLQMKKAGVRIATYLNDLLDQTKDDANQ